MAQVDLGQPGLIRVKVYIIVSVATEIEGRITAVKMEKGFATAEAAKKYMDSVPKSYPEQIKTETSTISCWCERNVQEIEIEV